MTPYELSPLEVASGLVLGTRRSPLPRSGRDPSPRAALEAAILPALRRPPCLVSFSGGRDSSAVLAVAAAVARREGLPLPVPATNRFDGAPASDEAQWQDQVVVHLGLEDWLRLDHDDELDCVGPVAAGVLLRHGLLWPFNAHFHEPLLRAAQAGSLLTGIGGDEIFGDLRSARPLAVLRGRARPEPRDLLRLGWLAAPRRLRAAVLAPRVPILFGWLRPRAARRVASALADQQAAEPRRWRRQLEWRRSFRYLDVGLASLELLARDARAGIVHPLVDAGFVQALASLPRSARYAGRTEAMRVLFGDVLPDDVLTRRTKSHFDEAFWRGPSRSFAERWSGEGVDTDLVDPDALRAEWASEQPDPRCFTLLQAAWLADAAQTERSAGRELEQPLGPVRE